LDIKNKSLETSIGNQIIGGPVILANPRNKFDGVVRDLLLNPLFTLGSSSFSLIKSVSQVHEIPTANLVVSKFFEKVGGFPNVDYNERNIILE
jgi:hypothetical protein